MVCASWLVTLTKAERFLPDLSGVRLGEKIGSGYFGAVQHSVAYLIPQVYSGWYKQQFVAVKLLCNETDAKLSQEEYDEFIMEGKLML